MKEVLVVYDDRKKPNREIRSITGNKSFGETIFKRRTLLSMVQQQVPKLVVINDETSLSLAMYQEETVICHLFSGFGVKSQEEFAVLMQKSPYVNENYVVYCKEQPAMGIFKDLSSYRKFVGDDMVEPEVLALRMESFETLHSDAFVDLSNQAEFMRFITSGFEARFFNALEGDEYIVTKRSTNKIKIKSEYNFYYLLPESMKMWFVMPFHYEEEENSASYQMERYHMTDIAIRFVHGAVDLTEFEGILKHLFRFINTREEKEVTSEEYQAVMNRLYLEKVDQRMTELSKSPDYQKLNLLIQSGTGFTNLEEIISKYKKLYQELINKTKFKTKAVVGHGDLCFSNILYQKDAQILRLIDPKGCQTKEELYTDPYYDLAKLSHSICGCYDFFNSGLYEIRLGDNMQFELSVDTDNTEYKKMFARFLAENGFDYKLVRLFEASLFLSMLPLHMDREQKVFGFILNALQIMEELQ